MATNDSSYNGWTNWETWNLNLWVTSYEAYYRAMLRKMPFTEKSAREFAIELFPTGTPDMKIAEFFDIDWAEIVEAWNEE